MSAILKYIQPKIHAMSNGLFANWTPINAVSVGDFGVLKNGGFERLGSLRDYGASIDARPATRGRNELEYRHKIDLDINATAKATVPADQGAKISVTIKSKGAFLYHLFDVHQIRPVDQRAFVKEIAKVLIDGTLTLPKGAVLVTELLHAAKATIIASERTGGNIELGTNFDPTGCAYLSGAQGEISAGLSTGSIFSWIARNNTVALLRLVHPLVPLPSGHGRAKPEGGFQIALARARDYFKARQLSVTELEVREVHSLRGSLDGFVIAYGTEELLQIRLSEVTLAEIMSATAEQQKNVGQATRNTAEKRQEEVRPPRILATPKHQKNVHKAKISTQAERQEEVGEIIMNTTAEQQEEAVKATMTATANATSK